MSGPRRPWEPQASAAVLNRGPQASGQDSSQELDALSGTKFRGTNGGWRGRVHARAAHPIIPHLIV